MKKIYILLLLLSSQLVNAQMVTVIETRFGNAFRSDQGLQVLQTPDRGYVLFGTFYNVGLTQNDFRLIKIDSNANVQWDSTYDMIDPGNPGVSTENYASQIALTSDGGYVMVGSVQNGAPFNFFEMMVIKTNANGIRDWTNTYGDAGALSGTEEGKAIREISGGGYIIVGTSDKITYGGKDIFMVKTDGLGSVQPGWTNKHFGDWQEDIVNDLEITPSGNYLLAGWSDDPIWPPSNDAYLLEINQNGDSIWSKRYPAYPGIGVSKVDGEFLDLKFLSGDTFISVGNTQLDLGGTTNRPYFIKDVRGSTTAPLKKDTLCCDTRVVRSVVFDNRDTSYTLTGEVGTNLMVMKMNSNYNEKWMSQYNLPINLEAKGNSIILNDSGNYVILGYAKNDDGLANISDDFYLLILKDTSIHSKNTGLIDLTNSQNSMTLYPNPLRSSATLSIINTSTESFGEKTFILYDVLGRRAFQSNLNGASFKNGLNEIKIPALLEGIYFYQLKGDNEILSSGKLVVE